jgi:modulator of FtsH protease
MGDWHDFLLALAGAAGVLTGLVFVGVSINLEKIMSQPGFGLSGRAAEALILLVAVLTAS